MMTESMIYWLSKRAAALYEAETVNAASKKVNKPSDDPLASGQILSDRTTLSSLSQYLSNTTQGLNWIEAAETVLETVNDLLDEAADIVTEQSTGDLSDRDELAQALERIYDQIIDMANEQYGEGYIFSGELIDVEPFSNETEVSGGSAEDIVFDLAGEADSVEITITDRSGNVVRTMTVSSGAEGTNTVAWDGLDDGGNVLADGDYEFSVSAVDSSGTVVANAPTYRGDSGDKEILFGESSSLSVNTDGGEIFSDILMTISQAMARLNTEPYDSSSLSDSVSSLATITDDLQKVMIDMSSAAGRLETAEERLELSMDLYEEKISELETADETESAIELETLKTAYEITMETASQIMNMNNLISLL